MQARDIMTRDVATVSPDASVREAAQLMTHRRVSGLPVVTADGRVINVIAVDTTHHGFNDSAIKAVGKWKFKPGVKNGRKVNTRMAVPINFNIIPNS